MFQSPYNSELLNPDSRPLPQGWVQQFDNNYKRWFYVNTFEQPPRSIWEHPLGPVAPPPEPPAVQYTSPLGYNQAHHPPGGVWNQGLSAQPQFNQPQYQGPPPGGWNNASPQGYGQIDPPPYQRGLFGSAQNTVPKKSGVGIGTAVAAGGVGLVGGLLLGQALEHHHEDRLLDNNLLVVERGDDGYAYDQARQESAYDEGYSNGTYDEAYEQGYENAEADYGARDDEW